MKRGFTLIELLGVIALLGVIVLVSVPSLIQSNKAAKENEIKDFNKNISSACETYAEVHSDDANIKKLLGGTSITINVVNELVYEGYLKGDLINPNTGQEIALENKNVTASFSGGNITCTYPK